MTEAQQTKNAIQTPPKKPKIVRVINKGPSPLFLRASRTSEEVKATSRDTAWELELEVGAHLVEEDFLGKILENDINHKIFEKQCDLTEWAPGNENAPAKGARVADLTRLSEQAAIEVANRTKDAGQLMTWYLQDPRPAVKKALHLRDRVLRPGDLDEEVRQDLKAKRLES